VSYGFGRICAMTKVTEPVVAKQQKILKDTSSACCELREILGEVSFSVYS
jgi:hypothetical protein